MEAKWNNNHDNLSLSVFGHLREDTPIVVGDTEDVKGPVMRVGYIDYPEITIFFPSLKKLEELGFAIQAYLDEKTREKEKEDLEKEAKDLAEISSR